MEVPMAGAEVEQVRAVAGIAQKQVRCSAVADGHVEAHELALAPPGQTALDEAAAVARQVDPFEPDALSEAPLTDEEVRHSRGLGRRPTNIEQWPGRRSRSSQHQCNRENSGHSDGAKRSHAILPTSELPIFCADRVPMIE